MNETLVMLAWCDPDCRRVRYTWSGIWVGILEASKERLTFRVNRQEIVSTEITDSSLIWRRTTKLFASRFDLHTADGTYRFYLSPPGTDAPPPAPDLLHTLSKSLDHMSVFGLLDGAAGAIGDAAGAAADALSLPGAVTQLRAGNRNEEILRAFIAGSSEPSPRAPTSSRPPEHLYTRGDEETLGTAASFGPHGGVVACAHTDGTIRLWNCGRGTPVRTVKPLRGNHGDIEGVEFSSDGRKLLIFDESDTVHLHDVLSGDVLASLHHDDEVVGASMDNLGEWAVTICEDLRTRVWNLSRRRVVRELESAGDQSVTFSPATQRFAVVGTEGLFSYSGPTDPQPAWNEEVGETPVHSVAMSRKDRIAVGDIEGNIHVFEPDLHRRIGHVSHDSCVKSIAFHPEGNLIAAGDREGNIIGWNLSSGGKEFHIDIGHVVSGLAWSPRGDLMAAACPDGLLVWKVRDTGHAH
ncbi:hypothetical protein ABZ960_08195 [Streptomyces pseudovenezuelae]|uniref:WD40 repeat domain-containing protein n=1 Tax=Streptomyces pseudovenezuelae TaxID=67350 RepID=UPI0034A0EA9D